MTVRLAAGIAVSALIRRVGAAGGTGTVLARGDPDAGAILLLLAERGRPVRLIERRLEGDGRYVWSTAGPDDGDGAAIDAYVARRRAIDGDLWAIELDIVGVERFAEELAAAD